MTTRCPHRWTLACALLLLAPPAGPGAAVAQQREARPGGGITGAVLDARTDAPVAGATVVLEPDVAGAFPGSASGAGFVAVARSTTTGTAGRYRFDGLSPGAYRLHVSRIGYRPYSVGVELTGADASVSVALEAEPIALEPVFTRGRGRGPYVAADPYGPHAELARLMVADMRRRRYLTTDVRELTHADVVESVTLGEPDVFRALQRLPGVTTRSDYTAELWTRGAPWSQTRVYFDGVPLFNPLHALGILSGIGSSSVGTVWFHPGVRSAGIGSGAAGVLDLRSRRGAGAGELNGQLDLSLMTAGVTLDQRVLDGRAGWMLSGRTSYLDWLADLARRAGGDDGPAFPYGFAEVSGAVDAYVGDGQTLDASWLWEGDHLASDGSEGAADPLRAEWGNALAQGTWGTRLGSLRVQHTLGGSSHRGRVRTDGDYSIPVDMATLRFGETRVDYVGLRGAAWPEPIALAGPPWAIGYAVERYLVEYDGPVPLPVPRSTFAVTQQDASNGGFPDSLQTDWSARLPVVALWGERSFALDDATSVRAGLRLETGGPVGDDDRLRLAPRVSVRYAPLPEVALSAGAARVYQYAQTVAPAGVQLASLVSTDAWLLAAPGIPPLRSDMATAGVEAMLAPGRVVTVNGFARRVAGVAMPDPAPGPIEERTSVVRGRTVAYGVELGVRQLTGPVTGSVAYSLSRSVARAAGLEFPSAADRTHVLDATAMVRPVGDLRLGAAATVATGVPFTPAIADSADCLAEPGCDPDGLPWAGDPHSVRAPAFASLDLLLDWTARVGALQVGIYGQLRNVLGRENATVYVGDGTGCLVVGCSLDDLQNRYERGVPRLPVVGIRVRH